MKVMVVATQCGGLTAFLQLHSSFLTREYPKGISPSYRCGLRYANESLSHHGQSSVPKSKYFAARYENDKYSLLIKNTVQYRK